jgi:hypothetical protein
MFIAAVFPELERTHEHTHKEQNGLVFLMHAV